MCQRVTCRTCNKPTFAGCGRHVEQVLGDVPPQDRCLCREKPEARPETRKQAKSRSLLDRLLGR
jgi:hypothetical protein